MKGTEAVTLLLCLGLCIGQLTTAYWVSRIISVIALAPSDAIEINLAKRRAVEKSSSGLLLQES